MKKLYLSIIIYLIIPIMCHSQLNIESKVYNFNSVVSGKIIQANFNLKNIGANDIKVKNISTSCGCTTVLKNSLIIASGKNYNLKVNFDTNRFVGDIEKYIFVYLEDSDNYITLTIKGNLKPQPSGKLEILNESINFGIINKNSKEIIYKKIQIINTGNAELKILKITHPAFLSITFNRINLKSGEQSEMVVKVLPTIYDKGIGIIKIETDAKYRKFKWVEVKYEVK